MTDLAISTAGLGKTYGGRQPVEALKPLEEDEHRDWPSSEREGAPDAECGDHDQSGHQDEEPAPAERAIGHQHGREEGFARSRAVVRG